MRATIPIDVYLKQLIDGRENGFIKVITGMRRCGKSTLLQVLFRDYLLK
nr:AAA family ATPase [Segatella salivae]